jgi:hypothetical protein
MINHVVDVVVMNTGELTNRLDDDPETMFVGTPVPSVCLFVCSFVPYDT